MKKAPSKWKLKELVTYCNDGPQACVTGYWVPARPCGCYSIWIRLKYAWKVFMGHYDVVEWPEQCGDE